MIYLIASSPVSAGTPIGDWMSHGGVFIVAIFAVVMLWWSRRG